MQKAKPIALTAIAAALSLLTACTIDPSDAGPRQASDSTGPKIVASTSWAGAFAKAAGATDIAVIASATLQHPPDYDPKPSDLATVAKADYVLFSEFDGFASKIKDAAGGKAKLVPVKLENTAAVIRAEVLRLAEMFGTTTAANNWLSIFDKEQAALSVSVKAKAATVSPTAVSHAFMGYWANFAGLTLVGTFGPEPVTPSQLADLTNKKPTIILANSHLPGTPEIATAKKVDLINFPGSDLDLLFVFRTNSERISLALSS